uniref:Serine/threonine kinase n=1 Tax=Schistosoma mansoni TaxID=6183 RepID=A0A5K4EYG4_SCHMA
MPLLSQEPLVNHGCLEDLYDIQQKIGDGHFADVNLCVCKSSNKKYAAKFIMKQRINTGLHGSSVSDIDREAFILANLQHENIVNLHEVFYREDSVVLILDLVTGGELFARVADCERLSEEEASNFVQQILLGVQHMHGLGIVHLDLKPENIMIEDLASRKIKIIDFGLARVLNPNESFQDMAGTPEFCAPEIVNFDPITFATDMWAVGVLTYILLTGISPFAGDTQLETFQNILDCIVDYSREEMQNVSDLAKDFIQKLLVKNPRKRSTVNECLQHPWIKPKDNKQSNYRRDSLISREKLSSLRHFIATNPNTSVLSLKNNNTEEQDKSPSSPTSPLSSVNINDRTRFSLPDNSVINKIQNTVLLDKIATESSSNQTLQNKQFCKKESNQNRNNSNSGNKIIKNEKVINHILQAKSLSAFKTNTSACSTNSGSPVVSHVNNSQNAENLNKQRNNDVSLSDYSIPIDNVKKLNPRNSLCDTVSKTSSSSINNKVNNNNNNNNNNSSTNTDSKVLNDLTNDKISSDSTSNKSINNSSTVSGSWRVNFQNNIIGRLGAAFAAATGHVTTSTHHHILNEVDSSSDHQLSVPAKSTGNSSSTSANTTTTATSPSNKNTISFNTTDTTTNTTNKSLNFVQLITKEVIVNKTNSLKSSKETNIKQSYSSFGAVSRAVKELEITANPMNNNNNSMTTTNTTINNNGNMADLKIVRRFQTLGMNQLAETTCVNRPLVNGYPNEKCTTFSKEIQ